MDAAVIAALSFAVAALGFAGTAVVFAVRDSKKQRVIADLSLEIGQSEMDLAAVRSTLKIAQKQIQARDTLIRDHTDEIEQLQDILAEHAPDGLAADLLDELLQAGPGADDPSSGAATSMPGDDRSDAAEAGGREGQVVPVRVLPE